MTRCFFKVIVACSLWTREQKLDSHIFIYKHIHLVWTHQQKLIQPFIKLSQHVINFLIKQTQTSCVSKRLKIKLCKIFTASQFCVTLSACLVIAHALSSRCVRVSCFVHRCVVQCCRTQHKHKSRQHTSCQLQELRQ